MAQSVSENLRGFSFMPENKVDVIDLQYIEGGELSRAWKMSRRERLKNIEAKIWDEFLNEKDIVSSVSSDDPYQFIEQLPDDCMRELMDTELMKMKSQMVGNLVAEQPKEQDFKEALQEPRDTLVTFADVEDETSCDMITILDDDDEATEGEREEVNDDMDSPCTVRERSGSRSPASPPDAAASSERGATPRAKSPDNVTNMIETSIYTAKVKELQSKVNLELLGVITTLEVQNLNRLDPNLLPKLQKQGSEFCARYCRIYLYPISRQIHDITRHNNSALPYARHTHIRSQMIRAASLQQNMLQALQVFHKWFAQKTPLRECVLSLKNFLQLVREADSVCPAEVQNEELLQSCESLNEALSQYMGKLSMFVPDETATNSSMPRSGKFSRSPFKKRSWAKQSSSYRAEADAKLSMYSLDRFHHNKPPSIGRSSGGTSKARMTDASNLAKPENADTPTNKKSNRSRRPLMRAPGGVLRRERPHEADNISTLVEGVDMTTGSARASMAGSSRSSLRAAPAPAPAPASAAAPAPAPAHARRKPRAPAYKPLTPKSTRRSKDASPQKSPTKPKPNELSEISEKEIQLALKSINASEDSLPSVIKVQCAKKDNPVVGTPDQTPRIDQSGDKSDAHKEKKDGQDGQKELGSTSDVSMLLRKLCAGQAVNRSRGQKDRQSGSKNAQLLYMNGGSPRQPPLGTPQLLRILEETIQKQAPKPQFCTKPLVKDVDRYRLNFNMTCKATEALFQYRTKFVQHMLSSPMYANSAVGKPWEMIGNVSEKIIDEILLSCAKEMELEKIVDELYRTETTETQ